MEKWHINLFLVLMLFCSFNLHAESPKDAEKQSAESVTAENSAKILLEKTKKLRKEQPDLFGKANGILVEKVIPNGQGEKAGLQTGDILLIYDGVPLESTEHLIKLTGSKLKDSTVKLGFLRKKSQQAVLIHGGKIGIQIASLVPSQSELLTKKMKFLMKKGLKNYKKGNYLSAKQSFNTGLAIAKNLNKEEWQAGFLNGLGLVYERFSQYPLAMGHYQQSLKIFRKLNNPAGEATSLGNLGIVYYRLSQYPRALDYYQKSLGIYRKLNNLAGEADSLNRLGLVYIRLSQYPHALDYHQQSLKIFRKLNNHAGEAESLNNLGLVYEHLSQYPRALKYYQQSLRIDRKLENPGGEAVSLGNLGIVYFRLSQYPRALDYLRQSLRIFRKLNNFASEASSLNDIGNVYHSLSQYPQALDYYQQSLKIQRELGNLVGEANTLNNLGLVNKSLAQYPRALEYHLQSLKIYRKLNNPLGEAESLNNLGIAYSNLSQYPKALDYYQQSLVINQKLGVRVRVAGSFGNLGIVHYHLNQYPLALEYFQNSLAILSQTNSPSIHWKAWDGLAKTYSKLKQPNPAILAGKQAINILQSIRTNNIALEKGQQKSFLQDKKFVYRNLADTLIEQGRLPEAEQVMDMFKEEEYFDFIQRDGQEDGRSTKASYTSTEHSVVIKLNESSTQLLALSKKHETLINLSKTDKNAKTQLIAIETELDKSQAEFIALLTTLADVLKDTNEEQVLSINLERMKSQQKLLIKTNAVIITTIVTEDKLHLLLTTPTRQLARQSPIGEKALNQLIERFRKALKHPGSDPKPLAQELYKHLIKPLENDLKQTQATTLMWSLDGSLRYLPLSVLHDGKQYLVERYALSLYTAAAHNNLSENNTDAWRIAGFGVSLKHPGFIALPSVPQELESIVRRNKDDKDGVISGIIRLDSDFTRKSFLAVLQEKYPALHIASHFTLNPGDGSASKLLLGDGDTLTLNEFRRQPAFKLHGVDLLTLSACETAVGGDGEGGEVESFAVMAQLRGAKGVMASLWKVEDESTGLLMQKLYQLRSENKQISKAEALRQAQLKLLYGKAESKADFSHPYFWAPFVMMGNWL